jgi:hypothetical protein
MEKPRPFNGRVIFDHLAEDRRRGDQIVAHEFAGKLGTRCVSPHLNGEHRALICRYGGIYSVIAAHAAFRGDGLDHFTCFREPIDWALSLLFFTIGSFRREPARSGLAPSEACRPQRWPLPKPGLGTCDHQSRRAVSGSVVAEASNRVLDGNLAV